MWGHARRAAREAFLACASPINQAARAWCNLLLTLQHTHTHNHVHPHARVQVALQPPARRRAGAAVGREGWVGGVRVWGVGRLALT